VEGIKALLQLLQSGQQSNIIYGGILNPQLRISEIRRKLLSAKNSRDIKEVKFLLTEYKKNNPLSFDVEELEILINRSLVYEEKSVAHSAPSAEHHMHKKMPYRSFSLLRLLFVILIIVALIIFFYRLLS
jgi:hypothetical protein